MSRQSEHSREWSLYCSYDSRLSLKTEPTPQEDELYGSDTLSTDVQHDDMTSSRESSLTSDSLYAPPSPRTLRCVAQNRAVSQYTSLRDVPPLSLDGAGDAAAHRGTSTFNKAPSALLPSALSNPCYNKYEISTAPTHPLSDSIPKGSLRMMNRDPPPRIVSSYTPMDGNSRIRLKEKPTRAKIDFTDPFAEKKQEQPMVNLRATLDEKQRVNAKLDDVTQQFQNNFEEFSEAKKHDRCNLLLTQPLIVNGQSASNHHRSVLEAPPPGRVLAGSLRLPNCYTCMYNETARHLHDIEEETRHKGLLEKQAEEHLLQRRKREQENLRHQTPSTWYWPGIPIVARTPTTTWIEDVHDVRPHLPTSTLLKDERMNIPATRTGANPSIQAAENVAPAKVDSKTEPEAVPGTLTPTASKDKPKSFASSVDLVGSSPPNFSSSDARAKSPAWYSHADCVQALGKAHIAAKAPSPSPKPRAVQNAERSKLRLAAKKIIAAKRQAEEDAQWDNIDLSDDEEWDKVAVDEGNEWEVLEK